MKEITFVTGNPQKAEQLGRHLNLELSHAKLDLDEIQSLDPEEIVRDKATRAYKEIGTVVLVEDTSLAFHALKGLPGPLVKWFLESIGNQGLTKLVDSYTSRKASAVCYFCLYDGVEHQLFKGSIEGSISDVPRGKEGFGWDPIFIPDGYTQTWGEMDIVNQDETSMRKIALGKLREYLKS